MDLMGISGFIHLDPSNLITKWVFIHLTKILKWIRLRLIQIRGIIGWFMDMDKNCHPSHYFRTTFDLELIIKLS